MSNSFSITILVLLQNNQMIDFKNVKNYFEIDQWHTQKKIAELFIW